ncbi:hypothetical protein GCM10010967_57670 [Dyadobacter beijingensis]|uniref:Metallo-beta-lactamase domain-containing protein n=1 Tax=Dyadobacter beijingensis TaxID=365489 RepID=A0ABQ2IJD1_9BACT|nr:MBL fold metallo-hydrolase [Dyadobacter beijingensis]GGN13922.1 hypothetical protein GCM10010967_57670 [Dyadobacter beijingensis]
MRIRFYQVDCGDAASILYEGSDGKDNYVFVDAGYERTYREILADEIKIIDATGATIDLWLISHIHDDHIGGAVSYAKAIERCDARDIVSNWWYNHPYKAIGDTKAPKSTFNISEAKSFAQSEKLTSYLRSAGRLPKFDIVQAIDPKYHNDLKINILSPTKDAVNKLREKYENSSFLDRDYHEMTAISEPKAAKMNDYCQTIESFDLEAFAEDVSIENESSIAILIEHSGIRILWLADSLPSIITTALRNLGYSEGNPLQVDLVKVSHHGSRGNNSSELYDMVRCDKYIFCGSGINKHQLPTKECMVRILKNKYRDVRDRYEFIFTHDNPSLRGIFDVDEIDIVKNLNFTMTFSASKYVDLHF